MIVPEEVESDAAVTVQAIAAQAVEFEAASEVDDDVPRADAEDVAEFEQVNFPLAGWQFVPEGD